MIDNQTIQWIIITLLYIFVGGFVFSWGPIPWIYCAEIFPVTIRAKTTSITTATHWMMNLITSLIGLILLHDGRSGTFITFAIFCAIMTGMIYLFYPETKKIHLKQRDIINSN